MDIKPPEKRRIKKDFSKADIQNPRYKSTQTYNQNNPSFKSRVENATERTIPKPDFSSIKDAISSNSPNFKHLIFNNKILILYTAVVFCLVFFLYLYRISALPKPTALDSINALNVQSFTDLSSNVVFGPPKFLDYILLKLNLASTLSFRLSSILFSILAITLFFMLIKRWLSVRIAVLSTLLFATSTWMLTQTRDSDFLNAFFLVFPALLITGSYIKRKPESMWIFPLFFLLAIVTYVPGSIWFILFGFGIYFINIKNLFSQNSFKKNVGLILTYILPILPLAYFLAKNPPSLKLWLGMPAEINFNLTTIFNNLADLPTQLFVSGINQPVSWLFGSPVIDAATGILALAGILFVVRDSPHPLRRWVLGGLLIICTGLLAIGGSVYISLLLPLVYIFVAFGIFYLLEQWFLIFPRNPVARSIGYVLMCLLLAFISFYQVSRYFIVWPRNDRVIESFESVSSDTINNTFLLNKGDVNE